MLRENRGLKPARTPALHPEQLLGVAEAYQAQLALTAGLPSTPLAPAPRVETPAIPTPTASQQLGLGSVSHPLFGAAQNVPYRAPLPPPVAAPPHAWSQPPSAPFDTAGGGYAHMMQLRTVDQIPSYPGQATSVPSLMCAERMAPTIITALTASGRDIESQTRALFQAWKTSKAHSTHSAAEAVCLARCIHLTILQAGGAAAAVTGWMAMEVMLRRLYALIEVERMVVEESYDRGTAWEVVKSLLEHRLESHLGESALTHILRREATAAAKFKTNTRKAGDK